MKSLLITCFTVFICLSGFAQKDNVIIGTKKVYLTNGVQKDSLLLPVVADAYPGLQRALSDTVLFAGDKLPDIVENYSQCSCGTTGFSYAVTFLSRSEISIKLFYEAMGGYPSSSEEWRTLYIATGNPVNLHHEFSDAGIRFITRKYKYVLLARINKNAKENTFLSTRLRKAAHELTASNIILNFLRTPMGIIFKTDNELPHIVQDMEPDREIFFSKASLKPFKKRR